MTVLNKKIPLIWPLLAAAFAVRLLAFVFIDFMFENDIRTFQIWATELAYNGPRNFYTGDMWSDYPPGFLYVLTLLGLARGVFGWEILSPVFNFFTLLPAMLADVVIGYVIYYKTRETKPVLFFVALWVFNPAIILISSVWGQVESVFLLPLVISLFLLREKKLLSAYIIYGVAILIKPQSLFLGPVYLFSAFDHVREHKYAGMEFKRLGLYILGALLGMLVLAFPFTRNFNYLPVFEQFWGGLDMYNFGTVNAFNVWALAGRNWMPLDARFLGLSHATWGVIIALVIIVGIMAALERDKQRGSGYYWLIVAGVFFFTFVFSVKMHERYMFPALLFFLLYALEKPRPDSFALYAAASVTFFVNCLAVLRAYHAGWDFSVLDGSMHITAWANVAIAMWMIVLIFCIHKKKGQRK